VSEIKILDFDTGLFGFKVARFAGERISSAVAENIVKECKRRNIKCCFAELDINDFASLNAAAGGGFVISDIRMTFEKDLCDFRPKDKKTLRGYAIDNTVTNSDLPYLEALAEELSLTSRFKFDRNFPSGSAERIYKKWMINSIDKKEADGMFIARESKTRNPVGIITYKKSGNYGKIILFAVSSPHRRKGLASRILDCASSCVKKSGIEKIRVTTESKNIPSQRLYQKNGFLTRSVSAFFHLWIK